MLDNVKNEIVVKTKTGDFKLLKNGKLEELPTDELAKVKDEVVKYDPETASAASARFYFDVEDELVKNPNSENANRDLLIKNFIKEVVGRIIIEGGVSEIQNQVQLKNIISSRLREVRNLAETREALGRLRLENIDGLMGIIEKYRKEVEEAIKKSDFKVEVKQTKPVVKPQATKEPVAVKEKPRRKMTGAEYKSDEKVSMRFQHETIGPVEEIRRLNLKDFRKLGNSPEEAADKVLSKINLLEDESLTKRAEGVKAWKKSEVYQLYLAIGADSMSTKKTVEEVVLQRKAANNPFLTPEEFEEVADLNKKLSY